MTREYQRKLRDWGGQLLDRASRPSLSLRGLTLKVLARSCRCPHKNPLCIVQFAKRSFVFVRPRNTMVPLDRVLHEAYAAAFHSIRNNQGWFAGVGLTLEDVLQFCQVMTICLSHVPTKGSKFVVDRFIATDVARFACDLQHVVVENCC